MTTPPDPVLEHDTLRNPWPSLVWIVVSVITAVTTLALAPIPV